MTVRRQRRPRGWIGATVLARVIDASAWVGCRVPVALAHRLAVVGGTIEWALRPFKRRRLAANLCHVLGTSPSDRQVRHLVRTEILNEARRSADLLWALGRPREFLDSVDLVGIEHAQRAADAGNGLIISSVHLGGWEVATAVPAAVLSVPTSVIVADDWLAWAMEHRRGAAGLRILYPDTAALRCVRLLRAGETLLLLADNSHWAGHTHHVRFLDSTAELPAGVVALARVAQVPIVNFTVLPIGPRRWRIEVDPALDPPPRGSGAGGEKETLERLADRWSEVIRLHPEHWAASHSITWETDGQ